MKKKSSEKRVINISKEDFDIIKSHCDKNTLDMVSWIVKNTTEKIAKKIPETRITAKCARDIFDDSKKVEFPSNWLELVLKENDEAVKMAVKGWNFPETRSDIRWDGCVMVKNKYDVIRRIPLTEEQKKEVISEFEKLGYKVSREEGQIYHGRGGVQPCISYYISW
jgi:hypothetical protein